MKKQIIFLCFLTISFIFLFAFSGSAQNPSIVKGQKYGLPAAGFGNDTLQCYFIQNKKSAAGNAGFLAVVGNDTLWTYINSVGDVIIDGTNSLKLYQDTAIFYGAVKALNKALGTSDSILVREGNVLKYRLLSGSQYWSKTQGSIYPTTIADSVGIGTNSPNNLFEVANFIKFDDTNIGTAIGKYALTHNSTGDYNTALGYEAIHTNTTGNGNIGIGYQPLYTCGSSSNNNIAIGYQSLYNSPNSTVNNIAIGYQSLYTAGSGSGSGAVNNIAIGYQSLYNFDNGASGNNTAIGDYSLFGDDSGIENTALGYNSLYSNTDGSKGVAIGAYSQRYAIGGIGASAYDNKNTSLGYSSLRGSATPANNTGNFNTAIGYETLLSRTSGRSNTAVGIHSLYSTTTGIGNTSVGDSSLYSNTTGKFNTAIGYKSFYTGTIGVNNISLGYYSGYYATGTEKGDNRLYVNSIDRTNFAGDTTSSIIYGYQNSTVSKQRLTLNSKLYLPNLSDTTATAANTKVLIETGGVKEVKRVPIGSMGFTATGADTNYVKTTGAEIKYGALTITGNVSLPNVTSTTTATHQLVIEGDVIKQDTLIDIQNDTLTTFATDTLNVINDFTVYGTQVYISTQTLLDDGSIVLPSAKAGYGTVQIGDNLALMRFSFTTAGVVSTDYTSGLTATTNSDGFLCVYDSGTTVTIINRLGSTYKIRTNIIFSSN